MYSDSFVNHFDGHFAYLKTLDFYFNISLGSLISDVCFAVVDKTLHVWWFFSTAMISSA